MTPDQRRIARQAAGSAITWLWDALIPLRSVNSFMQTGAHPDDETTKLLARLAKGDGVRIAYTCCVRGEGGQNDIGTERRNTLGVLRSREMEQAASVLGMELYWLNEELDGPIFDFGFSKSADETFKVWGREGTVEGLVRAIRASRPDVIAPTFLDVGGQHGHHRANTVATIEAFHLAGNPDAFPEHEAAGLRPWQPKKLYLPAWSGGGGSYDDEAPPPNATLQIEAGVFNPVHGATYAQMAQWSRAFHRTQGMGRWEEPGPAPVPLHRLHCAIDAPEEETTLFDGLPQTVGDLADASGDEATRSALRDAQSAIDNAFAAFPNNRHVARAVHAALAAVRRARGQLDRANGEEAADIDHRLAVKEQQLCRASACACLVVAELQVEPAELVLDESAEVDLTLYNGGAAALADVSLSVETASGWRVDGPAVAAGALRPGERLSASFGVMPVDTSHFAPYRFASDPNQAGEPLTGRVTYSVDEVSVQVTVSADETVAVLPGISVDAVPDRRILNLGRPIEAIDIGVTARNLARDAITESLQLDLPEGWRAQPPAESLTLAGRGAASRSRFRITPPANLSSGSAVLGLRTGSGDACMRVQPIAYPHIRRTYMIRPATVEVRALRVEVPSVRVGYVGGGADRADHWLRELGVRVDNLNADDLATGDLSQFETILVGVFAFGFRPDLLQARRRLRDYVESGGNLVTLYHRPRDKWDPETVPPRFLKVGQPSLRWRVTDANAAVNILQPEHPLLHGPNEIGPTDWAEWVKERGLYFAAEWADDYVPLLSMADPNEAPLQGALLSADIGEGRHTHTALILHYQMESLVPGAFRLMANLITPR